MSNVFKRNKMNVEMDYCRPNPLSGFEGQWVSKIEINGVRQMFQFEEEKLFLPDLPFGEGPSPFFEVMANMVGVEEDDFKDFEDTLASSIFLLSHYAKKHVIEHGEPDDYQELVDEFVDALWG
ncbi:hypothetical protein [Salinicola rhizosphaerae]|uniref:Uncharacterized protein n=1 Tax=Salinicola rhizosphaerae TaxID=1443141 RepID=A0ABQ3DTY5_9GAMM|nr:hypothetical protein [Salinicola rhizosphaerae]GHB12997.1 hypothetical protein GCM10009038_08820 [Salinicola rhizosphaerae]